MQTTVESKNRTVCVAVVNYNGRRYLAETLNQIDEHCADIAEIIVVDNFSTDGSIAFIEQHYPHVRLIARARNDGPGPARNLAIQSASTDLVFLLDNDVSPRAGCLSSLTDALQAFSDAVIAMPAIVYFDRPATVQFVGSDAHFMGTMAPLCRNLPIDQLDQRARYCTSMVSAALLVDKQRLGQHSLFNESLFIYQEDHEAGYRCGVFGLHLLRVPSGVCLHRDGTPGLSIRQTGKVQPMRTRQTLFNRWYILATLYQRRTLLRFLPALLTYEVVALCGAMAGGCLRDWLWAVREFTRRCPAILKQRRCVQQHRIIDDAEILRGGGFPFNTDIKYSSLEMAGKRVIDAVARVNWLLARPQNAQR